MSPSDFASVTFSESLEDVSFKHIRQKAILWYFLHLTSSNVLHEKLKVWLLNIFTVFHKRPKDVLKTSRNNVVSVTFSGRL